MTTHIHIKFRSAFLDDFASRYELRQMMIAHDSALPVLMFLQLASALVLARASTEMVMNQ